MQHHRIKIWPLHLCQEIHYNKTEVTWRVGEKCSLQPRQENVFPFFFQYKGESSSGDQSEMNRNTTMVVTSVRESRNTGTIPPGRREMTLPADSGEFGKSGRPWWISIRWRWFLHDPRIPQDVRISLVLEVKKKKKSSICVITARGNCVPLLAGSTLSARGMVCDYQEFRVCPAFEEINSSWCKKELSNFLQMITK